MTHLITDIGILYHSPSLKAEHRVAKFKLLSELRGISVEEAEILYHETQGALHSELGREPTGTCVMSVLGVPPQAYEAYNTAHVDPQLHLHHDVQLADAMAALVPRDDFTLLTNLGRTQAERTLITTGIRPYIRLVHTISDSGIVKPDPALLRQVLHLLDTDVSNCLVIGARDDVDIKPAQALGIATRIVRSRDDLIRFAMERATSN